MKEITRAQLYEKLWSTKFMKLTEELDIKDYTLRKICEDFNVPRPKSGYWTQLKFKKDPPKTILPAHEQSIINLEQYSEEEKSTFKYRFARLSEVINKKHSKELVVLSRLRNNHALIKELRNHFVSKDAFWSKNRLSTSHSQTLRVAVTKDLYPRFLRIIETFLLVLESRGHTMTSGDKFTTINVNGETFGIKFMEKSSRVVEPGSRWDYHNLVPNGKLSIKVRISYNDKDWIDAYNPLEEKLTNVIAYLELKSEEEKVKRAELENFWAEQDRLRRIKKETEARVRWEEEKKEILIKDAQVWHEQTKLVAFIEHMKSKNPQSEKKKSWIA